MPLPDFLGFGIRRYPNGKLLTKPGKEAMRRIRERLSAEAVALRGANADALIARLNPIITGGGQTTTGSGCPSTPSAAFGALVDARVLADITPDVEQGGSSRGGRGLGVATRPARKSVGPRVL